MKQTTIHCHWWHWWESPRFVGGADHWCI
jgi:hypothetical protein